MAALDRLALDRIRLADYNLNTCGVPTLPDGSRYVDIPKTLTYNNAVPANTDAATHGILPDERQGTQSNTLFMLGSISVPNGIINIKVRFQWPNGRYLQNAPVILNAAYGNVFPGYRKSLRWPVQIPPGKQIRIYFQNTSGVAVPVYIAFEGWLRFFLAPGESPACCVERL